MCFVRWCRGQESTCQCRRHQRRGLGPRVRTVPWRRTWQPAPVFPPGESHGQRSLAGYSPWGHRELDATEHSTHTAWPRMAVAVTSVSASTDI